MYSAPIGAGFSTFWRHLPHEFQVESSVSGMETPPVAGCQVLHRQFIGGRPGFASLQRKWRCILPRRKCV
jgi:hypothetical protein